MENIEKRFIAKIQNLLSFIRQTRDDFELVSEEMDDDHFTLPLRGLALESNPYEPELTLQLKTIKIKNIPPLFQQQRHHS